MNITQNCTTAMEPGTSIAFAVMIAIILSLFNIIAIIVTFYNACDQDKLLFIIPITSLLVGSTIQGGVAAPLYIYKILVYPLSHTEPKWLCDSSRFLRIFSSHVMKVNIMFLTLQRLYVIIKPSKYCTECLVLFGKMLYGIYMLSTIITVIVPFKVHPKRDHHCNYVPNRHWVISVEVVYSIFPLSIALFVQMVILRMAFKRAKADGERLGRQRQGDNQETNPLRATKKGNNHRKDVKFNFRSIASLKLIVISGIFLSCWFSLSIYFLVEIESPHLISKDECSLRRLPKILEFLSSLVIPLVYCWWNDEFQHSARQIFRVSKFY